MKRLHEEAALAPVKVDFPFTIQDTPALRARVTSDLARITERVRSEDPHLDALILTGGFARGEGSALDDAPLNDYDLVCVRRRPGGAALYGEIARDLERELGIHVDLAAVSRPRLSRVGAKVFWYETRESGRVLWGDSRTLARIRPLRGIELPPEEALRLLLNRTAGLLECTGEDGPKGPAGLVRVQAAKGLLAAQDARLLLAGHYHWSYRERARRFRVLERDEDMLAWAGWATAFKLDPARGGDVTVEDLWHAARGYLLKETGRVLQHLGYPHPVAYAESAPPQPFERIAYVLRAWSAGERGVHVHPFVRRPTSRVAALGSLLLLTASPGGADPLGFHEARKLFARFGEAPLEYDAMRHRLFDLRSLTIQ